MLLTYQYQASQLVQIPLSDRAAATGLVWMDLLNPTAEEDRLVESLMGIIIPTQAEMEEIELSARLYHDDGAEFMTMTALVRLDTDEPSKTPITFILKGTTLVTVRYAEPKPFLAFLVRAQKAKNVACGTGEQIYLGLLEGDDRPYSRCAGAGRQ